MASTIKSTAAIGRTAGPLLACASIVLALAGANASAQVTRVYQYDNTTSGGINTVTDAECTAGTGVTSRTFSVGDAFTASTIAVGLNVSHGSRGQIRAYLIAPDNTVYALVAASGDTENNYDILMSSNSDSGEPGTAPLDDSDTDPTNAAATGPHFNRLVTVAGLSSVAEAANGSWTLRVCDTTSGTSGTFNRARLVLTRAAATSPVCTTRITYDWGANGNGADFTSFTAGDVTVTETATNNYGGGRTQNDTYWNFRTDTGSLGGHAGYYSLYMDAANVGDDNQDSETLGQRAVFGFSLPVHDLEFTSLDSDQFDGDFEDIIRVEGTAQAGGFTSYSRTPVSGSPVFQNAGDTIEADSACDNGQTCATEAYAFSGAVTGLRFYYFAGDDIPSEPGDQVVGISDFQFCAFDFGDAPDNGTDGSYGTSLANGAKHVLGSRSLWLGALRPDGEADGAPNLVATGDDNAMISGADDEDGLDSTGIPACPSPFLGTYSITISASNQTSPAADGYLVGYIDWDRDGTFDNDTNEESAPVTVPQASADPSNYVVTWSGVPANCGGTSSTYARFRFTTAQARAQSPTDGAGVYAPDGEVEDYEISADTLPVTIARVESAADGDALTVRWITASEWANAGFNIWGKAGKGKWFLLGEVDATQPDSMTPQRYEAVVSAIGVEKILIEDLSLFGERRSHGPFKVGETAGDEPEPMTIDWAAVRAEAGLTPARAGSPLRMSVAATAATATEGLLLVREQGIHRVTHEQLLAAGIDLSGVPAARIVINDNGKAIARHVSASGGTFGPGSYIEFVAQPKLTLASPVDAYVLSVVRKGVPLAAPLPTGTGGLAVTTAEDVYATDRLYSFSAPNGDPWYDQGLLARGAPATLTRTFDLPDLAAGKVELTIKGWGYGGWEGDAPPDHHVVAVLNGTVLADDWFDGLISWERTIDVTSVVTPTGNTLEIRVPGDTGFQWDYFAFDGLAVRYQRQTVAVDRRFEGTVSAGNGFAVGGFTDGELVALWRLKGKAWQRGEQIAADGQVTVKDTGSQWAAAQDRLLAPGISAGVPAPIDFSTAQYVIVTHPAFADALDDLVALEQGRGLSTEVVTVDSIYAAYSDHAVSAEAIKRFLTTSAKKRNLKYALLVGSDTVDPYDHLGLGSMTFVPTSYLSFVQYVAFSPTDEDLADGNGDGIGDVPIGRLPVRTVTELQEVVAKITTWEQNVATADRSSLLAAGAVSPGYDLTAINSSFQQTLGTWTSAMSNVGEVGVAAVRASVLAAMNAGTPLVSFVGHSSAGQWDFTPVLKWQDIATLTNAGRPNLVVQWGCWNAYYVNPSTESLSGRLLRTAGVGAAAAIGATTLTTDASHQALGTLFFAQLNGSPKSVGDAFRNAKLELLKRTAPKDALLGMALLGDPAMSLPR